MAHSHKHANDGGEKNIKTALILNISFTIIEFVGGLFTNSLAILSDAIHDFGDSIVLIISFLSTKLAKKNPTDKYTFGYKRASLFAALIAGLVLLGGSIFIIINAIPRLSEPQEVHSLGMIGLAVIGVIINGFAVLKTREGLSQNEKVVSWHMLEDVLNWAVVLVGGIIIQLTGFYIIDPILTICSAAFIMVGTTKNLFETFSVFMESVPENIDSDEVNKVICAVDGVCNIHDVHIWSLDGETNILTAHVVVDKKAKNLTKTRKEINRKLAEYNIEHTTIEIEYAEECSKVCTLCNDSQKTNCSS